MSDEIERRLRRVSSLGAPVDLRPRLLNAVKNELQRVAPLPSRWSFRPAVVAAAALLASFALNLWVNDRIDRRLALVLGPQPVAKAVSDISADPRPGRRCVRWSTRLWPAGGASRRTRRRSRIRDPAPANDPTTYRRLQGNRR